MKLERETDLNWPASGRDPLGLQCYSQFFYIFEIGAGNETRTRDPNLGKVVLYQLSYSRVHFNFVDASSEAGAHFTKIGLGSKFYF